MKDDRLHNAVHTLWTKAVGTPDYIKAEWILLEDLVETQEKEIERLKSGNLTAEEFQNLCHNLTTDDRAVFEVGCREYQNELFGPRPNWLRRLLSRLGMRK